MKKIRIIVTTWIASIALTTTALGGTWQSQTTVQWKYQNDDGSYATGWVLDDGKSYYLDTDGIMLADTRTPDGYYVDASGVWDGQPPETSVITVGETSPTVGFSTSAPSTVYQPGTYQVGVDIPAGEYVLLVVPGADESSYEVWEHADTSYNDRIDGSEFYYNSIVILTDGQFLKMDGCTASPISQVTHLDSSQAGMYKIGYHIPAGTYYLQPVESAYSYSGYAILSRPTSLDGSAVIDIDLFLEEMSITVEAGQYLILADCILSEVPSGRASANREAAASHSEKADETPAAPPSRTVTAGVTERLSAVTSTPSTVYPAGIYEVGVSIPAGEYVVFSSPGEKSSRYEIRTNPDFDSYDDIVDSCTFSSNFIIRLEDGQFLGLEDCSVSPIAEVPQISFTEGRMFKAGYHIPAGTYRIRMTENPEDYGVWFILSAPTNDVDAVLSQDNIVAGADADITLTEGQYLQLIDCCIAE